MSNYSFLFTGKMKSYCRPLPVNVWWNHPGSATLLPTTKKENKKLGLKRKFSRKINNSFAKIAVFHFRKNFHKNIPDFRKIFFTKIYSVFAKNFTKIFPIFAKIFVSTLQKTIWSLIKKLQLTYRDWCLHS
jgi:hypothetical protein